MSPRSFPKVTAYTCLAVMVLFVGLLLFGSQAAARPGGGQHYHAPTRSAPSYHPPSHSTPSYHPSPSYIPVPVPIPMGTSRYPSRSSSSGSSGGGSAFGGLFFALVIIGIILLIVWLVIRNRRPQRASVGVDAGTQESGLLALRARDPGFDPAAFCERTRATTAKVNEAWVAGAMGPARRLISDGVYVRFQTQLALLAADGLHNVMADWKVLSADLLAAEGDDLWDTVHVKVAGAARDADVPLSLSPEQAQHKAASAPLSEYQEVWSFIRRRGKHTKEGIPALSGQCPSCGADLPVSDVVKCEYCKALVNSGEHDWVLAEITQPEEWRPQAVDEGVPGLLELRQRDPGTSRQELEDRASVMFWKWIEARSTGKRERLARFCVKPPLDAASAAQLGLGLAKLKQVAVGSAEVLQVEPAGEDGHDHVSVEVRWSASVEGREPEGMVHVLTLGRSTQAQSKRGLSSLDCPVCGGQLADSDAVTCPYCGETQSGGKHEWALEAVSRGELPEE